MIKIIPIKKDNLGLLAKAASKFGMPRSEGWLRRCMFDPTVEDLVSDPIRGHMAVDENGEAVAVQGYYYQPCYFKQIRVLGNTGCIMGADSKCGENLICVLDRNKETRQCGIVGFGNEYASQRSAKVSKMVSRNVPAPYRPYEHRVGVSDIAAYPVIALNRLGAPVWVKNVVWLACRPLAWLMRCVGGVLPGRDGYCLSVSKTTQVEGLEEFWKRFLEANTGLVSSREPERLKWLFEDSMKAGKVYMVVAKKGGCVEGYVLIRELEKKLIGEGLAKGFEIIDICAVGNESKCLRALARAAVSLAGKLGGMKVLFYGYMPKQEAWIDDIFRIRIQDDHPYFMYKGYTPEVKASLEKNEGWFFGPFDGERCMGYGGCIDL